VSPQGWRGAAWALLLLAGCDTLNPRPGPIRAMEPRPNPPAASPAATPQGRQWQTPWLTRFWDELTPAQRRRVMARLQRSPVPPSAAEAPAAWDVMGLSAREALVFGGNPRGPATAATAAAGE
jgi:hypothetical protein